jgi:hypothetical protein
LKQIRKLSSGIMIEITDEYKNNTTMPWHRNNHEGDDPSMEMVPSLKYIQAPCGAPLIHAPAF